MSDLKRVTFVGERIAESRDKSKRQSNGSSGSKLQSPADKLILDVLALDPFASKDDVASAMDDLFEQGVRYDTPEAVLLQLKKNRGEVTEVPAMQMQPKSSSDLVVAKEEVAAAPKQQSEPSIAETATLAARLESAASIDDIHAVLIGLLQWSHSVPKEQLRVLFESKAMGMLLSSVLRHSDFNSVEGELTKVGTNFAA